MGKKCGFFAYITMSTPWLLHRTILVNTENAMPLIQMGSNVTKSTSNTVRSSNEGNGDTTAPLAPHSTL